MADISAALIFRSEAAPLVDTPKYAAPSIEAAAPKAKIFFFCLFSTERTLSLRFFESFIT